MLDFSTQLDSFFPIWSKLIRGKQKLNLKEQDLYEMVWLVLNGSDIDLYHVAILSVQILREFSLCWNWEVMYTERKTELYIALEQTAA